MKIYIAFLLGVVYTSIRTSRRDKSSRVMPLLLVCCVVAYGLSTYRFA